MLRHCILSVGLALMVASGKAAAESSEGEVADWLTRLASGSAIERSAAERWLGIHLQSSDFPELARAARNADPEMARRIALALSSESKHLDLVVLFLNEEEVGLVAIGESAFEDLVSRWSPQAAAQPIERRRVGDALRPNIEVRYRMGKRREALTFAVDRYGRWLDLGVPLALAPVQADRPVEVDAIQGNALELLDEFCADNQMTYVGMGDWSGEQPGQGAWILVAPISGAQSRSPASRLARWCRSVEARNSQAAASARALAATGWPAALDWLDRRWTERGDANALEGLLLAAGRGRVARSLHDLSVRRSLMGRADALLDALEAQLDGLDSRGANGGASQAQAMFIARALIEAGPIGLGGERDGRDWVEEGRRWNAAQHWLRLFLLEGWRAAGDRQLVAWIESTLNASDQPEELRWQALRALAVTSGREGQERPVTNLGSLMSWALRAGKERELLGHLDALDFELKSGDLGQSAREQRALVQWWLLRGDDERAAQHLVQASAAKDEEGELSEALRDWRFAFGPRRLRLVFEGALALVEGAARTKLRDAGLFAGVLQGREADMIFEGISKLSEPSGPQLERLGALVAGRDGAAAERLMLKQLDDWTLSRARLDGLYAGLTLAVATLREAGLELRRRQLIQNVWTRVASRQGHPLASRLRAPDWPATPEPIVVDLEALDRGLPLSLLGR